MENKFLRKVDLLGINLDDIQIKQFHQYYELLIEWNKVMNLTGITDYDEVNEKHFVDSLSINRVIDLSKVSNIIDIGTGAGFPGLPLKIVFPHLKVVLLDSLQKRIGFLNKVIDELKLQDVVALHGRAEDYARNVEYREQFDVCVSRAVANLSILSEYCIPYVKVGGNFISYKSVNVEEELEQSKSAISILGGKIENIDKFNLPESNVERLLIVVKKKKNTGKKYPRKAGIPGKSPLGV